MKFTVVVTVFRRDNLLPRVLHCLASQTHKDWNAILLGDGQHIRVRNAVKQFVRQTSLPITYEDKPQAPGKFGNALRRYGLEKAEGDYVCFVGHDCLIDPGYLEEHARAAKKTPGCLSVVRCRYWLLRSPHTRTGREIEKYQGILPPIKDPQMLHKGEIDLTCMAFPRKAALAHGVFDGRDQVHYGADWLAFDACRKDMPVEVSNQILCAHF